MITTHTSSSSSSSSGPVCARAPYRDPFVSFLHISQEQYTGSEFVFWSFMIDYIPFLEIARKYTGLVGFTSSTM